MWYRATKREWKRGKWEWKKGIETHPALKMSLFKIPCPFSLLEILSLTLKRFSVKPTFSHAQKVPFKQLKWEIKDSKWHGECEYSRRESYSKGERERERERRIMNSAWKAELRNRKLVFIHTHSIPSHFFHLFLFHLSPSLSLSYIFLFLSYPLKILI